MNKRHLTAISRSVMSTPARYLNEHSLLKGRALDFGCGKGKDAQELGIEGYDPHYRPAKPQGQFDTIMCNFVLNVIEDSAERQIVLHEIMSLLSDDGVAYVSVRNDRKNLNGWTKKGTWQGFIELDLPVVKRTSTFVMYRLKKLA